MNKTILLAAALAPSLLLAQTPSPKPDKPVPVKQYTIEQFMATTRVGGATFSPDEKSILFHSNKSGIFNVYTTPVSGGEPKQLTNSTRESTYIVSAFPNDARFLYRYDKGGNENEHIYLRALDRTERDLTPGEKTKANFLTWSQDRKSFFFSTNARDAKFFDIYEMALVDLTPKLVYKDETGFQFGDISNDRKFIAFGKPGKTTADSDVYLFNIETKEMKHLTPHTGDVENDPQTFDVNSKYLYFLSNEGGEFKYIARYDLKTGQREAVEKAPWDVSLMAFSRNGKYRVVATNEDARTKIKILEEASGQIVDLPSLPEGDISGINISDTETKMAFYHDGSRAPANLYVYDFKTKKLAKLTESLNPEINAADLVDGRVARETNRVTRFGGFFDSVLDRYSDLALFMGLLVYYATINRFFYIVLTAIVMTGSVMVSYARARAEISIPRCKVGFLERPERVVLIIIGALFDRMAPVLWVIAVLSNLTVIHRMIYTWQEAKRLEEAQLRAVPRAEAMGSAKH